VAEVPPPAPPPPQLSNAPADGPPPARRRLTPVVVWLGAALLGVAATGAIAEVVVQLTERDTYVRSDGAPSPLSDPAPDGQRTTLLVGTHEGSARSDSSVTWLAFVSYDPDGRRGSVIFIPAPTAAEVPGRGLRRLGDAYASGGMPLLLVSAQNLLGLEIDHYLELSDGDARVLFDSIGPLSVEVPSEVRVAAGDNRARLIFTPGLQRLPSQFLTQLLYVVGLDRDDIELGGRHLAFWHALRSEFAADPAALEQAVRRASGALSESNATAAENADLFGTLVGIEDSNVTLATLPVRDVGGDRLYQLDAEATGQLLADVAGSEAAPDDGRRVQILNGNGVPGIGGEVGRVLVRGGFKVILSGNARRLDHPRTRIVTYDSSPEGLELARRAAELLGVGEIEVSPQTQGIVNLTVVVGKDFPRAN
jgi:anionic cell wall polymer biosynthesis LytR-Cps2A-Psr (LCP) family protein